MSACDTLIEGAKGVTDTQSVLGTDSYTGLIRLLPSPCVAKIVQKLLVKWQGPIIHARTRKPRRTTPSQARHLS